MQIFLKFVIADFIVVECDPSDTIHDLKFCINLLFGINYSQITLILNGKEMEESKQLKDYRIVSQNAMLLVIFKRNILEPKEDDSEKIRLRVNELRLKMHKLRVVIENYFANKFRQQFLELMESIEKWLNKNFRPIMPYEVKIEKRKELNKTEKDEKQLKACKILFETKKEMHMQVKKTKNKEWKMIKRNVYKQKLKSNHQKLYR